jgi:hypothetical protein
MSKEEINDQAVLAHYKFRTKNHGTIKKETQTNKYKITCLLPGL